MSEHPTPQAPGPRTRGPQAAQPVPRPPVSQPPETPGAGATGDVVIDAALRDLEQAPHEDLDAQIEAGQRLHQSLQARLSDLGGP